jgi:uncharacterized protein YijF (DUF1287 family)
MKRPYFIFTLLFFSFQLVLGEIDFYEKLSMAALSLTHDKVVYDPSYYTINYPNGDIPKDKGVCTDVVIRAYRKVGIDLQKEVHEDMKKHFSKYPKNWGLSHTDKNIDHRRVPNLMVFFSRFGKVKPNSTFSTDYQKGDVVCWDLGRGIYHIGMVVNKFSSGDKNLMVVHNIGGGQVLDNCLFRFKIIGHYSYEGK